MTVIADQIAQELSIRSAQVDATIKLLEEGATIPFIARYRKEVTGALDDTQLRKLDARLNYLRELNERRTTILKSIADQNKLTEALRAKINAASNKQTLEDHYLPYKPKRRTKGQIAIEAGLEPLAEELFNNPSRDPEQLARTHLNPEHKITDTKTALEGAKFILMERFAEDADLLAKLKDNLIEHGIVTSQVIEGEEAKAEKFRDYFDYQEPISKLPSHRALALFRGRNESLLNVSLKHKEDPSDTRLPQVGERLLASHLNITAQGRAADDWLNEVVRWTWRVKLKLHIENELLGRLRETAEQGAIEVFSANLKDLLLAAPAGDKATMGLDPGLRSGVKVAVVDATGKVLDHATIYPHAPQKKWTDALQTLAYLVEKHQIKLISIGNGTASRETEKLSKELGQYMLKKQSGYLLSHIVVSEAGASVYSASEFAANEFPDLDVTIRGAVSIARRLQDPLAELVKIEPKAIGVGQYQHDVSQLQLNRSLDAVVEDCVNAVGVDVNTASVPLLARVAGLNQSIANNIVDYRDHNGAFLVRKDLMKVSRLGTKAFEQCAGFLRIRNGNNPLDASAVHPESYHLVARMADKKKTSIAALIGNSQVLADLSANDFIDEQSGELTVKDVLTELAKPGRDPRPEFKFAAFKEGVETLKDLRSDMILEGCVTNVTHFGAFVDIGVHQDGLVHISALADKFVKDPREQVKTGNIVKVKVLEVDVQRKRIALSMRMHDKAAVAQDVRAAKAQKDKPQNAPNEQQQPKNKPKPRAKPRTKPAETEASSFALAFAKAKAKK